MGLRLPSCATSIVLNRDEHVVVPVAKDERCKPRVSPRQYALSFFHLEKSIIS